MNNDLTLDLLKSDAKEAGKFVEETIEGRRQSVLKARLIMGHYQHRLRQRFRSDKRYGIQLGLDVPATTKMDRALVSNQKWLYEALNVPGHEGNDILEILDITGTEGFTSDNPTVIRRKYRKKKKASNGERDEGQSGDIANAINHDAILPISAAASATGIEAPAFEKPTQALKPTRKLPRKG